jgi:C-terminal processing protease CtpA/Prc
MRYVTLDVPLSDRDARRPLYVLTAARTFSAGEGAAYLLQERRRAEIVGEQTAGAANPGRPYPVNNRFEVTVPNGRVRSAVNGSNWEGRGVMPDIAVPESDALRTAHLRALRRLAAAAAGDWRRILEDAIETLEAQRPAGGAPPSSARRNHLPQVRHRAPSHRALR